MARFRGIVFYAHSVETGPGIFEVLLTERTHSGDILRSSQRHEPGMSINDNLLLSNRISIVADEYALENSAYISHVLYNGTRWKVTSLDIERPRIILTLGGVYNE